MNEMEPLASVLRNRDAIKAVEETIAKVEAAIAEQREKINSVPDRGDLEKQRADIIARLALGEATEADLAEMDAEIAEHVEATKAAERKIGPARQAVEGLQRRRQQEQETLRKLLQTREPLRLAFYGDQEERAGVRVRRLADELHAAFGQLIALSMLSGSKVVSQSTPYVFPNLRLRAFADVGEAQHLHHMDELAGAGKADALLRAEKKRLADLGVE